MRAALALVLISSLALAEDDAPRRVVVATDHGAVFDANGARTLVEPGGRYFNEAAYVALGKEAARAKEERDNLAENVGVPVALVALGLVLAAGVGFGVAKLAR